MWRLTFSCLLLVYCFFRACDGAKTVQIDGDTLNFVMVGDWGGSPDSPYTTAAEKKNAAALGAKAKEIGSMFTVAMGDNFYNNGVTDVDDKRFQETFENVFTAPSLQKRWYVFCGNHDHYGNASAQVAYTQKSNRWYMPDFYYTETFTLTGSNTTIQFIFIDTVILAGVTHPIFRSLPPSGPSSVHQAEDQWNWIETTLMQSKANWIIVAGHYPVWSVAEHGPTDVLVQRLRPLLNKYNVSSYFCGHDHDLQHIQEIGSTVNYFVSGAGHLIDSSTKHESKVPEGSLKFRYGPLDNFDSHGGFNTVSITDKTMTVTFFDDNGKQLYSSTIPRTRW